MIKERLKEKYKSDMGLEMRINCSKARKDKRNTPESNLKRSLWLKKNYLNGTFNGMRGKTAYNKYKTTYPSKIFQYSLDGNLIRTWDSLGDIKEHLNINNISQCINGKRKTA